VTAKKENELLRRWLVGLWATYDQQPHSIGDSEHESMRVARCDSVDGKFSHAVYQIRASDIDKMLERMLRFDYEISHD